MPQTYDGAYASMRTTLDVAFKEANPPGDPDPEFDLQGHAAPLWGQHSLRRLGEKVARDDKDAWTKLGLTKVEVDLYSGWDQHEISRDMQIHYSGQQRSHRVKRTAITRSM